MEPDRWQRVKALFHEALELPAEERAGFLEAYRQDDPEIVAEVEGLLAVSETRANVFNHGYATPATFQAGETIDCYEIQQKLGSGGSSTVYLATDTEHDRSVALKFLRDLVSSSEKQLLGHLTHPNIARLYDSGEAPGGLRFVVMEYVEGVSLTKYCSQRGLSVRDRLRLFHTICRAVQYAHQQLIVHRDIKPNNILVTNEGEPKLLDFGIAKRLSPGLSAETVTDLADRPMTLAFASPEQIDGKPTAIATDIYSLGELLCVLLTGRIPYRVKSLHELLWAKGKLEPEKPSSLVTIEGDDEPCFGERPPGDANQLRKVLRGDLDAIVSKALRKDPSDRYASVEKLSDDVACYLDTKPVSARRGSRRYKLAKFLRRHRSLAIASVLAGLLVLGLSVWLLLQYRETKRERDVARQEATRANELTDFLVDIFERSDLWKQPAEPVTGVTGRARPVHAAIGHSTASVWPAFGYKRVASFLIR